MKIFQLNKKYLIIPLFLLTLASATGVVRSPENVVEKADTSTRIDVLFN